MTPWMLAKKLLASSVALLFIGCSATRPTNATQGPTGPLDLARYVLVIQETQDGRVRHDWKPLEDIELTMSQYNPSAMRARRGIVRVSSTGLEEYCEGRRAQCEEDCLASSRPVRVGHWTYEDVKIQPWREAKKWWCPKHCRSYADMCRRRMGSWAEEYAAEFKAIGPAVDWLKRHREEILVGTVIVIAGVAFVAASGGGALILVPLVLFAENVSGLPAFNPVAEEAR